MTKPSTRKKFNFKKEDAESVAKHLKRMEAVIHRKKDILDGNIDELGETIKRPRDEVKQIMKIAKESLPYVSVELSALLLLLKVDARSLEESMDLEYKLVKDLKKGSKNTALDDIQMELEKSVALGNFIKHQINLLANIQTISKDILNKVDTIKNKEQRALVGGTVGNLNDIANYLGNMILDGEIPNLRIAYNTLKMEGMPELEAILAEIESSFVRLQPKLP